MVTDIIFVLLLTFLSALGLITVSDWLMDKILKTEIAAESFIIADASSVTEENIEGSVRYLIGRIGASKTAVFLDCRDVSESSLSVCANLEKRFNCKVFLSEEELSELIIQSLQLETKSI